MGFRVGPWAPSYRPLQAWLGPACCPDTFRVGHSVRGPGPWGPFIQRFTPVPSCHPHGPGGVTECPSLAGTQGSIIMTISSVTLSMASCVRFSFPMTSLALSLVALTTQPGFVNTEGSSGLLAGQAVSSVSRVHLSRECRKEPPGWAQMERTSFLSHPALYSFPGACTTSTCAPSEF